MTKEYKQLNPAQRNQVEAMFSNIAGLAETFTYEVSSQTGAILSRRRAVQMMNNAPKGSAQSIQPLNRP